MGKSNLLLHKESKWGKDAEKRLRSKTWLLYSSKIARRILTAIESRPDMTQKKLAKTIDVSPQYISKVVKGKENLSLETIAKISDALKVDLISFPTYKYSSKQDLSIAAIENSVKKYSLKITATAEIHYDSIPQFDILDMDGTSITSDAYSALPVISR